MRDTILTVAGFLAALGLYCGAIVNGLIAYGSGQLELTALYAALTYKTGRMMIASAEVDSE